MEKEQDFELKLSDREYSALMDIRGFPQGAHYLLMCASRDNKGNWILQGEDDAFDELLDTVNEEIEYRIAPKKNLPALRRISQYLTPGGFDIF